MLLGQWGRDTLGLTSAQYEERVQVYKCLDRVWGNADLQHWHPGFEMGQIWGQHNTVLIDGTASGDMSFDSRTTLERGILTPGSFR